MPPPSVASPAAPQAPHFASVPPAAAHLNGHGGGGPASASPPPPAFNLQALLDARHDDLLDLHARTINPAVVGVLKTIGFDARYTHGRGAYLFDDQGRRYIDCLGGYAVFAAGRNHPVIREAIKQALDMDLPNLPGVGLFRTAGLLAEKLLSLAPSGLKPSEGGLGKVFFASGGGEAVDAAIKMARIATGRARIIYCHRSYHGLTVGGLSVTGNHEFRDGFGPLLADTQEIPFNDLPALEQALASNQAAAFIVEPIQGKGVNIPHADYLASAAALCKKHGTLLILDEIQTGLGRTGRWWAAEHDGMGTRWAPDMLVTAKALSGGIAPTSAVLSTDAVHAKVFPGMAQSAKIQNTFAMNDVSMAAGLAALHVIEHEGLRANAAAVGDYLTSGLRAAIGQMEMVKEVRGRGLMIAIEFQRPRSLSLKLGWDMLHKLDPNLFCQAVVMPLMSDHRILTQVAGYRLDVIKLIPPLVLTRTDADEIIAGFAACVEACHKFPGPAWEVGTKLTKAAARRLV